MLSTVLTIVAIIGITILIGAGVFFNSRFLFVLFMIKPFIDITVNEDLLGGFNALELSGAWIFLMVFIQYVRRSGKTSLFNHAVMWFFVILHALIFFITYFNGNQLLLEGAKFFLRLLNGYCIYFVASQELMKDTQSRLQLYKTIWFTTLIAGIITIIVYFTGISNVDTTRGVTRYNGLYNDPGTPSYLSVICLIFACLYQDVKKTNFSMIERIVFFFSWGVTLYIQYIALTKSALLMFVIFNLMWFGIYKRKAFLILPTVAVGIFLAYTMIEGLSTRFETEVNFVESGGDSEAAKSMGTGRVNKWEETLDIFYASDMPTKLLGTSKNFAAHNQYIAYLMQVGIIGLSVFVLILLRFYKRLIEIYVRTRNNEIFVALTILLMYTVYAITGHPFDYTTLLWYLMIMLSLINVYAVEKKKSVLQKLKMSKTNSETEMQLA